MADQLTALALALYGHKVVKTPNIDALAAQGTTFLNAYCNFPICAPSRFAMLSGQLTSRIGAWDNAAEFAASVPKGRWIRIESAGHTIQGDNPRALLDTLDPFLKEIGI